MSAASLKSTISKMYGMFDMVEAIQGVPEEFHMSLKELLQEDLHRYLMFLASSDGEISESEKDFMNELFDSDMTIHEYADHIHENNTYSIDFENDIPMSLRIMTMFDAKCEIFSDLVDELPNMASLLLDLYKKIGIEFITCDGEVHEQEKQDFISYISKKHDFLDQLEKSYFESYHEALDEEEE